MVFYCTRGTVRGKMRHRNKVHVLGSILCFLFCFDTLSECKGTNMEALVSEYILVTGNMN